MNAIEKQSILGRITDLDETEKRQLVHFLTENKIKSTNDMFVLSDSMLLEVQSLLDFMKDNKQEEFRTLEDEKISCGHCLEITTDVVMVVVVVVFKVAVRVNPRKLYRAI